MEILAKDKGIKRGQAYVDVNFPEAIRLVEHLGFERESIMKRFIGDGDAAMYARFF
jgi:RimJ/RimL family protein N-acetyltransferase